MQTRTKRFAFGKLIISYVSTLKIFAIFEIKLGDLLKSFEFTTLETLNN